MVGVAWAREASTGLRGATTRCGSACGASSEAAASGRNEWIHGGERGQEDMWDFPSPTWHLFGISLFGLVDC